MGERAIEHHPDHDRRPRWRIQAVFDPEGGGQDFAYTIGLDALGHPELHLWARPSLGDDPGEDWSFSPHDRAHVLNELGWLLVDGELGVGSEVERAFDDGEATVRFRVDPPGDRDELEAFGIAPGASVLPVRWSLHRPPEGEPKALSREETATARATRAQILDTVDRRDVMAPGWRLDGRARWVRDQRYGPLTPVVLARAAQLFQADVTSMNVLLGAAQDVESGPTITHPLAVAVSAARSAGRRRQLERLRHDVHGLLDAVAGGHLLWRRRWHLVGLSLWGPEIMGDPELAERAQLSNRILLEQLTTTCLAVEAVADVVDPAVLVHARGAWTYGLEPAADVPPERTAPRAVLDVVRALLRPLSGARLWEVAVRHRALQDDDGTTEGLTEAFAGTAVGPDVVDLYSLLVPRLRGVALCTPSACPQVWLAELPGWLPLATLGLVVDVDGVAVHPLRELHEWASVVTTALCHRARLTTDEVGALCDPFLDLVPDLRRVLDEPVVAA